MVVQCLRLIWYHSVCTVKNYTWSCMFFVCLPPYFRVYLVNVRKKMLMVTSQIIFVLIFHFAKHKNWMFTGLFCCCYIHTYILMRRTVISYIYIFVFKISWLIFSQMIIFILKEIHPNKRVFMKIYFYLQHCSHWQKVCQLTYLGSLHSLA